MPDDSPTPDEVWGLLTHLVQDTRDGYKRAVMERTGMPFSRFRVLRRLRSGPLTIKELAQTATMDAPAATVAVNDLEDRGLVVREIDRTNRRFKRVSLTEAGRAMLELGTSTPDPAPDALTTLPPDDLRTLRDLLRKLQT
ncbi:MarR family winged helix-turn-helix transcriptional regulator [Nocardia sp. NPDC003482]